MAMADTTATHATWYQVGPVQVEVRAAHPAIATYLEEFYGVAEACDERNTWRIDAEVGTPDAPMVVNRWGAGRLADSAERRLRLRGPDPTSLAISVRKSIREVLVDFCEQRGYVMLHASAVVDEKRVIVVVGDKGSGKTTLAIKAALRHGMRYLSNDHLIVYFPGSQDSHQDPRPARLALTSLPTLIPLKVGTYLDLEAQLPPPWDTEGTDVEAYRRVPRARLYGLDQRVLYTYRRLGQDNPITVEVDGSEAGPAVLVVLAGYTDGQVRDPQPAADPVQALAPHVRTDWMFDPALNQRYLPRRERDRTQYLADADMLLTALAARATVVEWTHCGDPRPLLEAAMALRGSR